MILTSIPLALVSVYRSTGSPSTSPKGSEVIAAAAAVESSDPVVSAGTLVAAAVPALAIIIVIPAAHGKTCLR